MTQNTDRRDFLKMFGGCAIAAGAAQALPVCTRTAYARLQGGLRKAAQPPGLDPELGRILYYASLAPSGHNSQPWVVKRIGDRKMIIGVDPERRLPAVDPDNREVMLSLGAFVENLSLAAGASGYEAQTDVTAKSPHEEEILEVTLRKAGAAPYPVERMTLRMTPKHGYRPVDLKKTDVDALAEPLGGRLFYFARGSEHDRCIREGTVEAFRVQTDRDEAQRELVRWLRLSRDSAERHRDGLTPEGMEILGLKGWYVRHFTRPEDFMKPGMRKRSVEQTAGLVSQGGGWFVITSRGRSVADLIETGRGFERMALLARERGIALHPMTQILEEETGRRGIASQHDAGMIPQFVLRVGYLDRYPDPVSPRRPVSRFLRR